MSTATIKVEVDLESELEQQVVDSVRDSDELDLEADIGRGYTDFLRAQFPTDEIVSITSDVEITEESDE